MPFFPHTDNDRQKMLESIGYQSIEDLFSDIPLDMRVKSFNIPDGRSELEVQSHLVALSEKNNTHLISFLGAGFYDHFIPAAVDAIAGRSEFYTSYTPYQPEVSQGMLQAIFEYQSSICRLTGMEIANASLYDGGNALFEAVMMALRTVKRNKVVVDGGVNPIYRKMLYCYTKNLSIDFYEIPVSHGATNRAEVQKCLDDHTGAVIFQNPNFFGVIDDFSDIMETIHHTGALGIASVYPLSLGILKTPGEMDMDIVTGEGQSLGIPLSFGGPYLDFMATKKEFVRKMPGRIVGATTDKNGGRGFVHTLQTREQHIRREKATSGICTNEALLALRAGVYLCLMGKKGLANVAQLCADKAAYTKKVLSEIPCVKVFEEEPTFNEFIIELPMEAGEIVGMLIEKGFAAGFPLGRYYPEMKEQLLIAVTEKRTKEEINHFAASLEAVICN